MPSRVKSPSADLGIRTGNSEIVLIKKKKKSSDQSDVFAHTETVPGGGETNRTLSKKKEKKNLIFIYLAATGLSCGMQTQLWHVGSCSLTSNAT